MSMAAIIILVSLTRFQINTFISLQRNKKRGIMPRFLSYALLHDQGLCFQVFACFLINTLH